MVRIENGLAVRTIRNKAQSRSVIDERAIRAACLNNEPPHPEKSTEPPANSPQEDSGDSCHLTATTTLGHLQRKHPR